MKISLRPYQLLCIICSLGEGRSGPEDKKVKKVLGAIRKNPDMPVTLRCNTGDVYVYQDPGTKDDTPEGRDYNRKRDLDVLQKLDLAPGSMLPARTLFMRLLKRITAASGICGYDAITSDAWKGCPKAKSGNYEKGRKKGINAIILPRNEEEMAKEKDKSVKALNSAEVVTIRPHILMCSVCQYGGGTRPPYKADNLPELLDMVLRKKPGILIKLARGADWMMCAPCPMRAPKLNACINVMGSGGLSNEKRDMDLLQRLGLKYGSTVPAKDLYLLLLKKIPATTEICRRDNVSPSVWWDPCGENNQTKGNENYEKGREMLMHELER